MYSRVSLACLLAYSAAYRNALLISFFLSLFAYQIQAIGPFVAPLCFSSLVVDCGCRFGDDRGKIGTELGPVFSTW
jgi:hypothetical protein